MEWLNSLLHCDHHTNSWRCVASAVIDDPPLVVCVALANGTAGGSELYIMLLVLCLAHNGMMQRQ